MAKINAIDEANKLYSKLRTGVSSAASKVGSFVKNSPISVAPNSFIAQTATKLIPSAAKSFYQNAGPSNIVNSINQGIDYSIRKSTPQVMSTQINRNLELANTLRSQGNIKGSNFLLSKTYPQTQQMNQQVQQLTNVGNQARTNMAVGVAKAGLTLSGAKYVNPATLGVAGALGAGIAKATGGNAYEGAGQAMGQTPTVSGLGRLTGPLAAAATARFGPLAQQTIGRGITGAANVAENEILARLDQKSPGVSDYLMSFGLGAILNGKANDQAVKKFLSTYEAKVPPEVKTQINDLVRTIAINFRTKISVWDPVKGKKIMVPMWQHKIFGDQAYKLNSKVDLPEGKVEDVTKGRLYDVPKELEPYKRQINNLRMSKDEFLQQIQDGLKNNNLNRREQAQNFIADIKKSGMTPEEFYASSIKDNAIMNPVKYSPSTGGDLNKALEIESSIRDNLVKIQKDFTDGKITMAQRKALAEKEFARSSGGEIGGFSASQGKVAQSTIEDVTKANIQSKGAIVTPQTGKVLETPLEGNQPPTGNGGSSPKIISQVNKTIQKPQLQSKAPLQPQIIPEGNQSSGSIISRGGTGHIPEEKIQAFEQQSAGAELDSTLRSMYNPNAIKDFNRIKAMARAKDVMEGDVETLYKKNPKLAETAFQAVKEQEPNIKTNDEAYQYILDLPTARDAKMPVKPRESFGKGDQVYLAEPTKELQLKIQQKEQKLALKKEDQDFREWSSMIFKKEGGVKNKEEALLNTIGKNIEYKTNTNAQRQMDIAQSEAKNFFVTTQKGKVVTSKGGSPLERDIVVKAQDWKDKPRLSYARETMDRNFEDIMGKSAPEMKARYLEPVHKAEANRIRWLNNERGEIKSLGIAPRSEESKLVQKLGEGLITKNNLGVNAEKIIKAEQVLRGKYEKYLGEINGVLVRNGYDPIPKRKDYFRHFTEVQGILEKFGIPVRDNVLPTDINGLSADFKPGKNFFTSALQRKGTTTDYDAIQGIDQYIDGASKQIFHTDNIQNLRLLDKSLRETYAGTNHLSNFVADLTEYTNAIAGKKAMIDRSVESALGRGIYGATDRLRKQVGMNMVGANISSAATNYIPLTQALATTNKQSFVKGMLQTIASTFKDDGFTNRSDFLTRRAGSDPLSLNTWEKIGNKSMWLMRTLDKFTAGTIVRSKYDEFVKKGLSPSRAMEKADGWAAKVLADRSIGSMPTLFNSKTLGLLTQFQLEVNNQMSFMAKDIPREFNKVGAASALGQMFLYGYIFNNLYEKAFGRRPAFDPIGVAQNTYEDYTNPDMKQGQATKNLMGNVSNQLPFASALTGGRIPIGSAIPNPIAIAKGDSTIGKEAKKLFYLLPPAGGGQLKKTIEGIGAYRQGGSTSDSGRVRYPIPKTPVNAIRTAVSGQYSTPEAREYFREGKTTLGDVQSEVFKNIENKEGYYKGIEEKRKFDNAKEKATELFMSNDKEGALKIMRENKIQLDKEDIKTFKNTQTKKAADLFVGKKKEEALEIMRKYKIQLDPKDLQKAAKRKAVELYKLKLTDEALAIMKEYKIQLTKKDIE